jgi:hypothetical protein
VFFTRRNEQTALPWAALEDDMQGRVAVATVALAECPQLSKRFSAVLSLDETVLLFRNERMFSFTGNTASLEELSEAASLEELKAFALRGHESAAPMPVPLPRTTSDALLDWAAALAILSAVALAAALLLAGSPAKAKRQ